MTWTDAASALQGAEVCHCRRLSVRMREEDQPWSEEQEGLAWERAVQLKTWW